jgi:5'-AMP-activated protein kinase catalytic alpha subunit
MMAAATPATQASSSPLTLGNYKLGKTLGVGSFGKVKVAEHIYTGNKVAIKILNRRRIKNLRMDEKIRREIQNLKLFRHPHIIRLYEVIETPTDIFMVMEYVSGGELFDFIVQHGKLSEDEGRRLFQQIISGVEYCHSHMVVHRDLKPENLLLDTVRFSVKIADFGLSNMMQDGDFLKTSCGSPNYAAPEVISGRLYAGPEVDVWSCGVILYALLCAKLPFDDEYIPSLFKKIREGVFVIPEFISPSCADLIRQMLIVDPLKRITIGEIRKHPWFLVKLPKYLTFVPTGGQQPIQEVNDSIVSELLSKYGDISKEKLLDELRKTEPNEYIVAYHLLYDARHNPYQAVDDLMRSSDKVLNYDTSVPQNLREGEIAYNSDGPSSPQLLTASGGMALLTPTPGSPHISMNDDVISTSQKKWSLGVVSDRTPPSIMGDVFRALLAADFQWKITGPYQLRCLTKLKCRRDDGNIVQNVKITLQLFKVSDKKYLLDVKKIEGDTFLFFDACSNLLDKLKI